MNKAKKNLITSAVAIILAVLTVTVYFLLPYAKSETDNTVFLYAVGSEILAYVILMFYNFVSDKKQLAFAAGGYTITVLYLVLSAVISLIFGICFRDAISVYKIISSTLSALFMIFVILIYFGGKKVAEKTKDAETACAFFKSLEYKVESLCADAANEEIASELRRISDAVKSCDQSNSVTTDMLINQNIDLLKEILNVSKINMEKMSETSDKIMRLIKQRNAEASQLKMGGI